MTLTIEQALAKVPDKMSKYFKYKYPDLYFREDTNKQKTPEEFLESVNLKSFATFERFERTDEYKSLLAIYINTKVAHDFEEIYKVISNLAKTGDDKAVRLFLNMQKDIQNNAKAAVSLLKSKKKDIEDEIEDDGLVLD